MEIGHVALVWRIAVFSLFVDIEVSFRFQYIMQRSFRNYEVLFCVRNVYSVKMNGDVVKVTGELGPRSLNFIQFSYATGAESNDLSQQVMVRSQEYLDFHEMFLGLCSQSQRADLPSTRVRVLTQPSKKNVVEVRILVGINFPLWSSVLDPISR